LADVAAALVHEALGFAARPISRRVPVLARHVDGSYARWIARGVNVGKGTGEGLSGLGLDAALKRTPHA
jgi:hypothetical protein